MRFNKKSTLLLSLLLVFLLTLFSANTYAQTNTTDQTNMTNQTRGHYYIKVQGISAITDNYEAALENEHKSASFWDLPLWVKIASIIIISLFSIAISLPIISKVKIKKKNISIESIEKYISNNPSCTISEVAREHHMSRGNVRYYINLLVLKGKILINRTGKFLRLSINKQSRTSRGSGDKDIQNKLEIHLRNEKMKQILYAILDKPGIVNQELSIKLGLDKSTIHDYLKKLSREGIIEIRRNGKFKEYYIKHEVKVLLIQYRSK